jgi:PKD repeat protein
MKKLYSKNVATIIISLIIILFACKKTNVDNITPPPPPPPPTGVTASVAGRVIDLNNAPLSGASVAAGASTTVTDANGQFTFKDIQLDKDAGFVKVTKTGQFTGSRTFLVNANTTSNVKIKMIPKTVSGTIAAASGGNVDVTGGAKINFPAGSFVSGGSNATYSGDASVAGFYLDPAVLSLSESKPGDLRAISITNNGGILKSFGMLSVEMNDAGGQKLQLAAGKTATITIPIPSAMQAAAPATIPLWYFDETKGIWKEEGTATKQSTGYTGTVTHFSFWSAGQLTQSIKLSATFKDSTGHALTNQSVWISWGQFDDEWTSGYTDNTGTIGCYVPANTTLKVGVISDCGGTMYKKYFGPFSTDVNLGNITILDYAGSVRTTLSGTAVNCNNSTIARGFVTVTLSYNNTYQQVQSAISNGTFNITFNVCKNLPVAAAVYVYDSVTNLTSNAYPITINSANQNIGQINACANGSTSPVADFTYSIGNTSPVTVTFNNTSTNSTSWTWVFGDGYSSSEQNPTHIYTTYGNLLVTLTATGPGGSNSISKVINISGTSTSPIAGFTYSVGNTSLPVMVTFNNTSTNATSWLWNFGDSTSSSVQNPTHSYTTSGGFIVTLTATGPGGSNNISQVISISGSGGSGGSGSDTTQYIYFTLKNTNNPWDSTTYSWAPPDIAGAIRDTTNNTLIQAAGSNQSIYFYILNDNASPGNHNILLSAVLNGISYPNNSATTTITEYGPPGGFIIGTASGQMKAQDSTTSSPFSMRYRVKRN